MNKEPKCYIDFIITQVCSYRCKYCSQAKAFAKKFPSANSKTITSFYRLLDNIDTNFEITITGGEAILHPNFYEIVSEVIKKEFKLNLITNGSSDIEKYEKLFSLTNEGLNYFDISFHIDEIQNFNSHMEKIEKLVNIIPNAAKIKFFIPIYNLDNKKEEKINVIVSLAKKYGINYEFQHIRILDKYIDYREVENIYFKDEFPLKTREKLCFAGYKSAVIYENGECYRCYSSRFLKSNYIGNINDENFKLNDKADICTKKICTCPKPKEYNQISNKKAKGVIIKDIKNCLYFPYLLFKNKDIAIQKLKQKLIKSD